MLNLLFPKSCVSCNTVLLKGETVLCAKCLHGLPLACHHRNNNPAMKNVFYGRFPLEAATSLLFFQKRGSTQELLHQLKYKGRKEISSFLGAWLGAELKDSESFATVDLVIPVPLHKQRLRKRGYNQVEGFGKEIAKALAVPYCDDVLLKVSNTGSQVFKKRFTRFEAETVFTLARQQKIDNKHILLVDDIVTTGATLEQCATHLLQAKGVKLSVATMAIA